MKINPCRVLLLLGLMIFSCTKESFTGVEYPSEYHKSGTRLNGNLRVFASNGEVRDAETITHYREHDSANLNSYFRNNLGNLYGYLDTVKFSDARNGILIQGYTPYNCLIARNGPDYTLTRTDTTLGTSFMNEISHNIEYYIVREKPAIYSESLYSSTRGVYLFNYTTTEKYIFSKTAEVLVAPVLLFNVYNNGIDAGISYFSYKNNYLQEDFFKYLNPGDTVAVSEYFITYENK